MPKKSPTTAAARKRTAKKVKVSDLVPRKKVKGGLSMNYAKIEVDYKKQP
jgi:hypothetical protein